MAQRACHAILHSRHIVHGHQEARQGIRGCCDASLYTSGTSNIKVSFKEDSLQPDSKLVSGSHTLGRRTVSVPQKSIWRRLHIAVFNMS